MTSSTSAMHADAAGVTCRIGTRGVSRSFGSVWANANVDLTVRPGTIHAVVGENGAGKSTLMRMLYGLDQPESGSVLLNDEPVFLRKPSDGLRHGIGLVQQELAIIPELSLLENLVLGAEPRRFGRIDWATCRTRAAELARSAGVEIDWSAQAAHTSIAIQQQVEILRLMYRGANVLILDEPTAVLAPAQADDLIGLLIELRNAGRTIVFISHKLDEVLRIADEITVMRSGRTVASLGVDEVDAAGLAAYIIGDSEVATSHATQSVPGHPVLTINALSATDDRGFQRLANATIIVHANEIVGVAAVAGNGQEELAEATIGIRRVSGGSIHLAPLPGQSGNGTEITRLGVRARRRLGMTYVSADRKHEGLALTLSLADNVIAGEQLRDLSKGGWLRHREVAERVRSTLARASVRFGTAQDPASSLSGGNQQRVVVGRETYGAPRVIIGSQPTRGVDVRGIGYIHELLRQAKDNGAAILLFSEELDELRELADRIVVLHRGVVVGEVPAGATRAEIGQLMLGSGHTVVAPTSELSEVVTQ